MKTTGCLTFCVLRHARLWRSLGRNLLASVLALTLLGTAPSAFAETHAVIPGATVLAYSPIAVDSSWHYIYTLSASSQVQATWYGGGHWNTATLGTGAIMAAGGTGKLLYVDPGYHFIYYVGTDSHLHCWLFNGSAWVNVNLIPALIVSDVVGVDTSTHVVWVRLNGTLMAVYYNGSAWVFSSSGVTDYDGDQGGVVDNTSHALYWNSSFNLRALVYTGRCYAPVTFNFASASYRRPAVHQGTGEVYNGDFRIYRLLLNGTLSFSKLDIGAADDINGGYVDLAVNPVNGKLYYYRQAPSLVSVLTPSGTGAATTWTRTDVYGASAIVGYCALDTGYGWYIYTPSNSSALHIVY